MRTFSDRDLRERTAEDLTLQWPRWYLVLPGIGTGILWSLAAGWFAAVALKSPEWAMTPVVAAMDFMSFTMAFMTASSTRSAALDPMGWRDEDTLYHTSP